jgi:hypothetical protein
MLAVDDKGMQNCVADYNWRGTTVARDARDCRVAIIAATVEDGSGNNDGDGGKQRWWTTKAADDISHLERYCTHVLLACLTKVRR